MKNAALYEQKVQLLEYFIYSRQCSKSVKLDFFVWHQTPMVEICALPQTFLINTNFANSMMLAVTEVKLSWDIYHFSNFTVFHFWKHLNLKKNLQSTILVSIKRCTYWV